jgi:hypothetical protein
MKTDKLVALLQATQGVKTVKVKFSNGGPSYTYKTLFEHKKDEWVVVEARGAYSTAKIVDMDEVPDINPDADFELAWVVCKVDTSRVEAIREEEKSLARQIAMTEAKKRIENVLKETGFDLADLRLPALTSNV